MVQAFPIALDRKVYEEGEGKNEGKGNFL